MVIDKLEPQGQVLPVCQTCGDQGDVYVIKHEGELPSYDLTPCPDCTKAVADEQGGK